MKATDVAILDEILGGITPGLPVVIAGAPGSGRTVLSLQLAAAALGRRESVVIVTSEPPELLLRQAESLGFGFERAAAQGRLALLELDPRVASQIRVHGGEAFAEAVRREVAEPGLVIFESVSALTEEMIDEAAVRGVLRRLFELPRAEDGFAVATVDKATVQREPALERALSDLCGCLVRLDRDFVGERTLSVDKSRTGSTGASSVPFEIGEGGLRRVRRAPTKARREKDAEARERPRVLVAATDDEDRVRIGEILGDRYQVVTADNGFRAMSLILSEEPDAIVIETELPRITGHEVMRSLQVAGSTIPVLAVSGNMERMLDRVRALFLGAADVQNTPLNPVELLHKVETLLSLPDGPPDRPDAEDTEALLTELSRSRVVDEEKFSARLERLHAFADKHSLDSTVLILQAADAETGSRAREATESVMREDDVMCVLGEARIAVLMVLTPETASRTFLARLETGLRARRIDCSTLRWAVGSVGAGYDADWKELFARLQPWPDGSPT